MDNHRFIRRSVSLTIIASACMRHLSDHRIRSEVSVGLEIVRLRLMIGCQRRISECTDCRLMDGIVRIAEMEFRRSEKVNDNIYPWPNIGLL